MVQKQSKEEVMKRWCGPWRVVKALSEVTYRIEEENRKPAKRRQRKVVHFNYLKPCYALPEETQSAARPQTVQRIMYDLRSIQTTPNLILNPRLRWNGWTSQLGDSSVQARRLILYSQLSKLLLV